MSLCDAIADNIVREQSVKCLGDIRKLLFSLLSVGYKAEFIVDAALRRLLKKTPSRHHSALCMLASEYVQIYLVYF